MTLGSRHPQAAPRGRCVSSLYSGAEVSSPSQVLQLQASLEQGIYQLGVTTGLATIDASSWPELTLASMLAELDIVNGQNVSCT